METQSYDGMLVHSYFAKCEKSGTWVKRYKVYHHGRLIDDKQDKAWKAEKIWLEKYGGQRK